MPGTDSRNAKRAAASRVSPSASATVIVMPERDVPGTSASAWPMPISRAWPMVRSVSWRLRLPKRSTRYNTMPNTASWNATMNGLRRFSSMKPLNSSPASPTGIVPMPRLNAMRP
jgi:hypothetical protein